MIAVFLLGMVCGFIALLAIMWGMSVAFEKETESIESLQKRMREIDKSMLENMFAKAEKKRLEEFEKKLMQP